MNFEEGQLYHVYNRGINHQPIFYCRENYLFFIKKIKKYLVPIADILSWNLLPGHFNFLIYANEVTGRKIKKSPIGSNCFSEGIRIMLSSYTKAIQLQEEYTGNLFQQKTKGKCLTIGEENHGETVFHYIHRQPVQKKLVNRMEDWEFSSYRDYLDWNIETFCNRELARKLLNLDFKNFKTISQNKIVLPGVRHLGV